MPVATVPLPLPLPDPTPQSTPVPVTMPLLSTCKHWVLPVTPNFKVEIVVVPFKVVEPENVAPPFIVSDWLIVAVSVTKL